MTHIHIQVIFANADGPRDAASRPIDHIALHTVTELKVECIHQATAFVDIDITLLHRPTLPGFSTHVNSEVSLERLKLETSNCVHRLAM